MVRKRETRRNGRASDKLGERGSWGVGEYCHVGGVGATRCDSMYGLQGCNKAHACMDRLSASREALQFLGDSEFTFPCPGP
jgi:hypothetical protein